MEAAGSGPQLDDFDDDLDGPPMQPGGSPAGSAHAAEERLMAILSSLQQNQQVLQQNQQALGELMRDQLAHRAQSSASQDSLRGKDLARVLQPPAPFEARNRDEELARWSAWSWQLESWLCTLDTGFTRTFELIKAQGQNPISMGALSAEHQERSKLLFGILSGLLHERGRRSLRAIPDKNGCEALRSLQVDLMPGNRSRLLALLQTINQWPSFNPKEGFSQQMLKLEAAFSEYDDHSQQGLSEDTKIACLLRCVTGQLKQHLNVAVTDKTKYADLRSLVLRWDNAQTRWDNAVAATYSLGDGRGGQSQSQPMEVDSIGQLAQAINQIAWKGKGKSNKGKDKSGKGKGKTNKGKDKSKGKGHGKDHGQSGWWQQPPKAGKGKGSEHSKDQNDRCLYCGKPGHWKRDCFKFKRDKGQSVNQVSSAGEETSAIDATSITASTVAPSHSASNVPAVPKRIQMLSRIDDQGTFDLTAFDDDNVIGFGGSLRMVQSTRVEQFDMSCGDSIDECAIDGGPWKIDFEYSIFDLDAAQLCALCAHANDDSQAGMSMLESSASMSVLESSASASVLESSASASVLESSASASVLESSASASVRESSASISVLESSASTSVRESSATEHSAFSPTCALSVRAVTTVPRTQEIILDSGADCSALPMSFKHVGVADRAAPGMYVDAQGNPLRTAGVRIAEVSIGQLKFKERFVISDVTMPLISLGKLYRAGWYVVPQGESLQLTDGIQKEPVGFRKQSLCVSGSIRVLSSQSSTIRAIVNVTVKEPLLRLNAGWSRIDHRIFGMKTFSKHFIDTTLIPLSELIWRRTTLIRRGATWELIEFSEDITNLDDMCAAFDDSDSVDEVITIAHSSADLTPSDMFFEVVDENQPPASRVPEPREEEGAPASEDPQHVEPPVDQREELVPPESVEIDGVIVDGDSSLAVMRNACKALGLPEHGNRAQIFKRLGKHCVQHELLQKRHVSHTLQSEFEREPRGQSVAEEPSREEIQQHSLTHEPYRAWCKYCVSHRARQDQHASVADHEGSSSSVISIDFGFLSRKEGDRNKLTVLFAHDRFSKAVCAIPTPRKGGQAALSHMTTELCRFVLWLGHRSITLRSDNENSVLAVVDGVRKILRAQGVEVHKDSIPIDAHQSNGPVEQAVQSIRQLACTLMSQLEAGLGAAPDSVLFDTDHPMWQWAICHAAWVKTRFSVTQGCTPYERLTGSVYRGKVCIFGEAVMAYLKQSPKAAPKWQRAVWLGKTVANDVNILGVPGGIFVSRSVRRFSDCWDDKLSAEIDTSVWQHGLASLGGTLVLKSKKPVPAPQPALALPVEAGMPTGGDEAVEAPQSDVAASDPTDSASQVGAQSSMSIDASSMSVGANGGITSFIDDAESDAPRDASMPSVPERSEFAENPKPSKQQKTEQGSIAMISSTGSSMPSAEVHTLVGCEEQPCVVEIRKVSYQHEDESVELAFDQDAIDAMEQYDYDDYQADQNGDSGDLDPRLCRPRLSETEPECSEEEMRELDSIADQVEISRLKNMAVLQDASTKDLSGAVHLTTKMVRTWRQKEAGNPSMPIWYRRSRYVAREYAWLTERNDLFSPASSSLCNRLLPILFMYERAQYDDDEINDDDKLILFSVDIGDAFLTVPQVRPTYVTYVGVDGVKEIFYLGFVLPGQRSGSSDWYDDFMGFLKTNLNMTECEVHPSLVKSLDDMTRFLMQMHVDDMLGFGTRKYVHQKFLPTLKTKYRVTAQTIEKVGDAISFLKRKHSLISSEQLLLTPSPKHFDKLFELLGLDESVSPKKTPYMSQLDDVDNSPELNAIDGSIYRSGIGLLLYLSVDLPECQGAIRALSSRMARPTQLAMLGLRHLGKYLLATRYHGLMIVKTKPGEGLMGPRNDASDQKIILESFSDANWASCKSTRRSVSASVICVAGNMLFSSSRTQRVVALSTGEAEMLAAASSMCDSLMIKELLRFADYGEVKIFHHIDASAAKAMLERSGSGKVRHLSCRVLWTQQMIKSKQVSLLKISTTFNPSDLGTKGLSRSRTRMLQCLIRTWDELTESFVGFEELSEEREKQSFRANLRILRDIRAPIRVSKSSLRALVAMAMVSAASALSPSNAMGMWYAVAENLSGLPTLYAVILPVILGIFVCGLVGTLLIMKPQPIIITGSFDQQLNKFADSDGYGGHIDLRSRSCSIALSDSSTSTEHKEVTVTQKRVHSKDPELKNPVWVAKGYGKRYHLYGCGKLNQAFEVTEISEEIAIQKGLEPCSFCNPHLRYHPKEFVKNK